MNPDPDDVVRLLWRARVEGLPQRVCSAEAPMQAADKDRYWWHHPDAVENGQLLNLVYCTCPHCGLSFTCFPKPH